jgi:hypothetical protein
MTISPLLSLFSAENLQREPPETRRNPGFSQSQPRKIQQSLVRERAQGGERDQAQVSEISSFSI